MLASDTGYLRLKQFSESSKEDLEQAMWSLYNGGMRNLVLDLRGNPGGLLTEAVEVSDLFLPKGRIVATKGRNASDNTDERATFAKTWGIPLIVLVDANSASASEIFAAAIQDNGRGVIVGRKTYGKGTVQTHFPLQTVAGELKLTTAKFYSPSGREMAGAGVTPDVSVPSNGSAFAGSLSQDPDVSAALQSIQNGTAARMANAVGQRNP
jgi:carboxyl-terminal processing protease